MSVKDNLLKLKESIPKGVTLVAVSKTKPNELILEAYESGQRDFGENYVQELVEKQKELPADIHWHFIGHLQTNKVKQIIPFAHLIHGVDSVKLLKEINKESAKIGKVTSCLLQIYIADEETKFGLDEQECRALLKSEEFSQLKNIKLEGFMGMASNTDDEEKISSEFRKIVALRNEFPQYKVLSFGMSGDYQLAIKEGSTMIRVGSLIFGERNYNR